MPCAPSASTVVGAPDAMPSAAHDDTLMHTTLVDHPSTSRATKSQDQRLFANDHSGNASPIVSPFFRCKKRFPALEMIAELEGCVVPQAASSSQQRPSGDQRATARRAQCEWRATISRKASPAVEDFSFSASVEFCPTLMSVVYHCECAMMEAGDEEQQRGAKRSNPHMAVVRSALCGSHPAFAPLTQLLTGHTARWTVGSASGSQRRWRLRIMICCRLAGGGCKQSVPMKGPPVAEHGTPAPQSTTLLRPNAPVPPPLRGAGSAAPQLSAKSTPLGTPQQARQSKSVGGIPPSPHPSHVVYTRHGDEDDALVTVHGVDDVLSEVDVHSVEMDGYLDLPTRRQSLPAAESDGALSRPGGRKSVSELSHASSRGTSALSFGDAAVSGAASEYNEAAPNGHSDLVLRRLFIDHSPVTGELGRGGYGVVYRAHDQVNGDLYAVKEAHYGKTGGDALMNNLRSEFRTLSQLHHPNIVRVYNFLIDDDERVARIVMELATNGSVRKLLARAASSTNSPSGLGRLPELVARRVVYQSLLGLHYLHRNGIIHRDIKPDNLLLGDDSVVKLSDFGTCKSTIHASTGTTTTVVGTVCYMSPESISGSFSAGSDIWSVGAATIELLSGLAPWSELRCTQSIHLVFQIGSARPPNHRPQLPPPQLGLSRHAVQFLEQCTMYDPKQRPTAADLLSCPWFDGVYDELPVVVRRYIDANPIRRSSWWKTHAPPAAVSSGATGFAPAFAPSTRINATGETVERAQQQQRHRHHPPAHVHQQPVHHDDYRQPINGDDTAALSRVGVVLHPSYYPSTSSAAATAGRPRNDDDTFETWPSDNEDEEEEVAPGDEEDEYEYEYV